MDLCPVELCFAEHMSHVDLFAALRPASPSGPGRFPVPKARIGRLLRARTRDSAVRRELPANDASQPGNAPVLPQSGERGARRKAPAQVLRDCRGRFSEAGLACLLWRSLLRDFAAPAS